MESGVVGGVAAFAYVAALWYAAPLLVRESPSIADRLRGAIVLGVAIPGVLGLLHLLYAPIEWIAVVALAAVCIWKRPQHVTFDAPLCATLAAALVVCWPPLVRPLLEGDTLLYHLPIAAAFVQTHSIWTSNAPYWSYPAGSELFAAGLLEASGRWSLPLGGILPALLITARIYSVARATNAPAYAAAAIALAFICMPAAAFQAGTLQNDLWLAAFFIEILAAADRSPASIAIGALLKPFGFLETLVAAFTARLSWRAMAFGFVPLAVWCIRDVALLHAGAAAGFSTPPYLPSTIAGNLAIALPQLAHGISTVTPQSVVWIALIVAGLVFAPARRYAIAGCITLVIYAFLPVSYSNGATNYVVDAASLRYALPALACGALVAAALCARAPVVSAVAGFALAAWGASGVLHIFWNDSYTQWAIAIALLGIAVAVAAQKTRGLSIACFALAVVVAGRWGASTRALGFYADWMRDAAGKPTAVFAWLAEHHPEAMVAKNVRTGAIFMVSPRTRAIDSFLSDGCTEAKTRHAMLLVGSNESATSDAFTAARSCGRIVYSDGAAMIVDPLQAALSH